MEKNCYLLSCNLWFKVKKVLVTTFSIKFKYLIFCTTRHICIKWKKSIFFFGFLPLPSQRRNLEWITNNQQSYCPNSDMIMKIFTKTANSLASAAMLVLLYSSMYYEALLFRLRKLYHIKTVLFLVIAVPKEKKGREKSPKPHFFIPRSSLKLLEEISHK